MVVHRNIKLLTWLNFCIDFRIYNAITILYFTQITGSFALGLSIFSVGTIASAIFEVPTGILSDLVGRKTTVIFGQLSGILAIVSYAIGGTFYLLALGAVFEGLARAFFSGNNSALLYDSLKEQNQEDRYAEYEGKTSSMFQLALGIAAVIGSISLGWESFRFLFILSIIPQCIGLLLAFYLVEPKRHSQIIETNIFSHLKTAINKFVKNRKLRTLSLAQILGFSMGESMHQFFPAFIATLWPVWAIPIARVFSHVFAGIGYRFAGNIIKRLGGELRTLLWSSWINFTVSTIIIAFPTIVTPFINSLTSLGFGTGSVAQSSLLQKEFSDQQRATMGSLNSLAGSILFAVMAFALGTLADTTGPRHALLTIQVLSVVILYLHGRLFTEHVNLKKEQRA